MIPHLPPRPPTSSGSTWRGPALHKKPAIVLDRHCLGFDQTVGFLQALEERNGSRSSLWA
jgi:hypothetical protein